MKSQTLVKRYAQGLLNSAKDEEEYESLFSKLADFEKLLSTREEMKGVFTSPFLPIKKKKEVGRAILEKISLEGKLARFILLLIENNRIEFLPSILERLPDMWNERRGIATFEAFSVIPLSPSHKERLEEILEKLEQKPVALKYRIDPSLIGGLSVKKGNIVYDISIQGGLAQIKEIIKKGQG